jgi:hypothetical protein
MVALNLRRVSIECARRGLCGFDRPEVTPGRWSHYHPRVATKLRACRSAAGSRLNDRLDDCTVDELRFALAILTRQGIVAVDPGVFSISIAVYHT